MAAQLGAGRLTLVPRTRRRLAIPLAVAALGLLALPAVAPAKTYRVTTSVDGWDAAPGDRTCSAGSAGCTLRAALQESAVLADADRVEVPAGTYGLVGEPLTLGGPGPVTVVGAGPAQTVITAPSGGSALMVLAGPGAPELAVRRLTLQGGSTSVGGGAHVEAGARFELRNAVVQGGSVVSAGGGIYSLGTTTVIDSVLRTNNGGAFGGAIRAQGGHLAVVRSTITGNRASRGGGISVGTATAEISESTISANEGTSYGAGLLNTGTTTISSSTIVDNAFAGSSSFRMGAGIRNAGGTLVLSGSIVARNTGGPDPDCEGPIRSGGGNLVGRASPGCTLTPEFPEAVDRLGVDPRLGPLEAAGPTQVHRPLFGSPAIDANAFSCAAIDQTGTPRPLDGDGDATRRCDAGAVERAGPGGVPPSYAETVLGTSGLGAYWRLGEPVLSGSAADAAGTNTGTYLGGVLLGEVSLVLGADDAAALFDGEDDRVRFPRDSIDLQGNRFSLEAWVQRSRSLPAGSEWIFSNGPRSYLLGFRDDRLVLRKQGVGDIARASGTLADTDVHHVVVTKDGARTRLYVDGADWTGTVTNRTVENTPSPLVLGSLTDGRSKFRGRIDEAATYSRALTLEEVQRHHAIGRAWVVD